MAFFNIGDRVTVRSDLQSGSTHYLMEDDKGVGYIANSSMVRCAGKTLTISGVYDHRMYRVLERAMTEGNWAWTDEMFEEYIHRFDGAEFETATQDELMSLIGWNTKE